MPDRKSPPKEGDIYKIIQLGSHRFELRYGFYEDFERRLGEPVVIYPDLEKEPLYDASGKRIVTAIQDPCRHYRIANGSSGNNCCCDCEHYRHFGDDIGICACCENQSHITDRPPSAEE